MLVVKVYFRTILLLLYLTAVILFSDFFSRFSNGDTYEGYMQKGLRHGYGVLHTSKGDEMEIYFGGWQGGMRSGYGVSTSNSTALISVKILTRS